MSIPAVLFNTSAVALAFSINNGAQISLGGVSPASSYAAVAASVAWSPSFPAPGVLAPGANHLVVFTAGAPNPSSLVITLPSTMPWHSLQLYLAFDGPSRIAWWALNDGAYVAGNLPA